MNAPRRDSRAAAPIRDQIEAGAFLIRRNLEEWQPGSVNGLLDIIARNRETTGRAGAMT